ncbi:MAG: 4Fe-4S binding protein [Alphaproteobacteria bacterium]|nr:4Fe-4S binding protein [Alphaproteobacteria bacterium]
MTAVVNDNCTLCKTCVEACPVDAFRVVENMLVIDPDECIDCGVCITECPCEAITTEEEADEKWVTFNAEKCKDAPNANE